MGLDTQRLAKRAVLSQVFNPPRRKWNQLGNEEKKPRTIRSSWRTPLQRYQYDAVDPGASGSSFKYDYSAKNQYFHPYTVPGYRPDLNIGNESWNNTKFFGTSSQDQSNPSNKWSNILNKVPTPIFGTSFEKDETFGQKTTPDSTWFSDILGQIY